MSKSFRFDPEDDYGGDHLAPMSRKELKAARRARKRNEDVFDQLEQVDDEDR